MKIAFATRDGEHVDAELRSAPRLDVYAVTPEAVRLERSHSLGGVADGIRARLALLAGVELVYVSAIGPSAAARLAAHGIRPATSRTRARIDVLLHALVRTRSRAPGCPRPVQPRASACGGGGND